MTKLTLTRILFEIRMAKIMLSKANDNYKEELLNVEDDSAKKILIGTPFQIKNWKEIFGENTFNYIEGDRLQTDKLLEVNHD